MEDVSFLKCGEYNVNVDKGLILGAAITNPAAAAAVVAVAREALGPGLSTLHNEFVTLSHSQVICLLLLYYHVS